MPTMKMTRATSGSSPKGSNTPIGCLRPLMPMSGPSIVTAIDECRGMRYATSMSAPAASVAAP